MAESAALRDALEWIVGIFEEHEVPYQLVGGLAAHAYGATRPIADIDFYVSGDGLRRIRHRLEPFFTRPPTEHVDENWALTFARLEYGGAAIELGIAEGARFRDRASGAWEEAGIDFEASERRRLYGVEVDVMLHARLVAYKRKLAREVDLRDLEEISNSGADTELKGTRTQGPMQTIASRDGTRIAFWRSGRGPPLLLVHGAIADHSTTWRLIRPALERRFTVFAMDRRGRGGSGDAPDYALQREAEDVAAVVDSIGGNVRVLGHSYGALCAVEAALLTPNMHRMVLYEGVPLRGADGYPPGLIDRLEALLRDGEVERMLIAMMRDLIGRPPEEIELLRADPEDWATRLRNAPTVPRELRSEERYLFEPERFGSLSVPTLLLVGGDSPPRELENARGVAAALPNARVALLPGQHHIAMYTDPEGFVREALAFLEG